MNNNLYELSKNLQIAIMRQNNSDDLFDFLFDLLSESEILDLSMRINIAILLNQNKKYSEIEEITGASTKTIAKISKKMKNSRGGYKKLFDY